MKKGFTLVEILIAVAIISILGVVVILTINPAELLRQGRDVTRISDMSTLNKAISLYYQDAMSNPNTLFMGTSSVIYVSVPDPSATSTAGDQCQGLGLPSLASSTLSYHCAETSTYTRTDGTGWIPINFNSYLSGQGGSVISKIPVDPTNATSTNFYYTYETDGLAGYKVTSFLESQKYASQMANDSGDDPELYEKGTNLLLASGRGLVAYWPVDEGTGSSTINYSGNNATGTWHGTAAGTSGYYSAGKVWSWAGFFNGSNDYALTASNINVGSSFSIVAWVNPSASTTVDARIVESNYSTGFYLGSGALATEYQIIVDGTGCNGGILTTGTWQQVVGVYNGSVESLYVNGVLANSCSAPTPTSTLPVYIGIEHGGVGGPWKGSISDVRIYNTALPATEIQEMYNATK